jgi:hypothetical protein
MNGPSYGTIYIIPLVVFLASHFRINPKRIKEPKEKRPKVGVFDLIFFFSFLSVMFYYNCSSSSTESEETKRELNDEHQQPLALFTSRGISFLKASPLCVCVCVCGWM